MIGRASHSRWAAAWAALAAVLLAAACRKPEAELGRGLLPSDPLGLVIDTVPIHAFTKADTSFRSNALSRQLLGSLVDPRFGLTRTGIATQVRLSASSIGAGQAAGIVADSIVLALAYDGAFYGYGNLDPQVFRVHELDERLSLDSSYRSSRVPATTGPDLVAVRGGKVRPQPTRKPFILGDSLAPQLRLRLSDALAQRFRDALGTAALASNEAFLGFFKGLYITVENDGQAPYQGAVLYFNLLAAASKLTLYYRDLNSSAPDQARALDFPINSSCVRYTVVEHDRSQAVEPWLAQALSDTSAPPSRLFVQTLAGTRAVVDLSALEAYRGLPQLLAKAELVVPVGEAFYPYHPPPAQLVPLRRTPAGADAFLPDQLSGGLGIGGEYDAAGKAYVFNITRFAQGVIKGTLPPRMELLPGSGGVTANRAVLNGPAAQDPMRLRLTFTSY